jgi:hypothetical protein
MVAFYKELFEECPKYDISEVFNYCNNQKYSQKIETIWNFIEICLFQGGLGRLTSRPICFADRSFPIPGWTNISEGSAIERKNKNG